MKILSTKGLSPAVMKTIKSCSKEVNDRKRYSQMEDVAAANIKEDILALQEKWEGFNLAFENGLEPFRVVSHLDGEVFFSGSKKRACNTIMVADFINSVLTVEYGEKEAHSILTALNDAGILPALSVVKGSLSENLLPVLGANTKVEHSGARTIK